MRRFRCERACSRLSWTPVRSPSVGRSWTRSDSPRWGNRTDGRLNPFRPRSRASVPRPLAVGAGRQESWRMLVVHRNALLRPIALVWVKADPLEFYRLCQQSRMMGSELRADGRRVWLASGSMVIPGYPGRVGATASTPPRTPGLNCVDIPIFWNRHEPRPNSLTSRATTTCGISSRSSGTPGCTLSCALDRSLVKDGHGGSPAWLADNANLKLRTGNNPYLEACSRFINAVADQVKDKT